MPSSPSRDFFPYYDKGGMVMNGFLGGTGQDTPQVLSQSGVDRPLVRSTNTCVSLIQSGRGMRYPS